MSLDLKKVRYSSRYGYSVEWNEPGSIRLTYHEALFFYSTFSYDYPTSNWMSILTGKNKR